jgi:hypothetical protein
MNENQDGTACCGGTTSATQAKSEALQAASELAGHDIVVAVRTVERGGASMEDFNRSGLSNLKMRPLCCSGPLFNGECSDMSAHHGQCTAMALRSNTETPCTADGIFQAPASEIAARVAQISSTKSVADVLPKCETHKALVIFNGCMECGHVIGRTCPSGIQQPRPCWS